MSRVLNINGYSVEFPFKPYGSQLGFMSQLLRAIKKEENALLESPTGSGKSLALLCSALAWQRKVKEEIEELNAASEMEAKGDQTIEHMLVEDDQEQEGDDDFENVPKKMVKIPTFTSAPAKKSAKIPIPKIYFCTRTHSQIAQIVSELKSTAYRPVMSVLGSRNQFCIHSQVITIHANLYVYMASFVFSKPPTHALALVYYTQ